MSKLPLVGYWFNLLLVFWRNFANLKKGWMDGIIMAVNGERIGWTGTPGSPWLGSEVTWPKLSDGGRKAQSLPCHCSSVCCAIFGFFFPFPVFSSHCCYDFGRANPDLHGWKRPGRSSKSSPEILRFCFGFLLCVLAMLFRELVMVAVNTQHCGQETRHASLGQQSGACSRVSNDNGEKTVME